MHTAVFVFARNAFHVTLGSPLAVEAAEIQLRIGPASQQDLNATAFLEACQGPDLLDLKITLPPSSQALMVAYIVGHINISLSLVYRGQSLPPVSVAINGSTVLVCI
jgi:hypothetical protein